MPNTFSKMVAASFGSEKHFVNESKQDKFKQFHTSVFITSANAAFLRNLSARGTTDDESGELMHIYRDVISNSFRSATK